MRLLLTSSGISNPSIKAALLDLLGKPIEDSRALCVPTGIYPFPGGPAMAARMVLGQIGGPLCDLGWQSLGILELTALPSLSREVWEQEVQACDVLLVWGGDPLYIAHWMRESGLAEFLRSARSDVVYVGVSAGAMAATSIFGETYPDPPNGTGTPLTSGDVIFCTPEGELLRTFVTAHGAGLVDFALIPHYGHEHHLDASPVNAEIWASQLPVLTYAIDDQSAIKVRDGAVDVVSEGDWTVFAPGNRTV